MAETCTNSQVRNIDLELHSWPDLPAYDSSVSVETRLVERDAVDKFPVVLSLKVYN